MNSATSNIHENPAKRVNIAESMPFLPPLAATVMRLLHRTCRFEIVGEENYRAAREINPRIAAFWHFFLSHRPLFFPRSRLPHGSQPQPRRRICREAGKKPRVLSLQRLTGKGRGCCAQRHDFRFSGLSRRRVCRGRVSRAGAGCPKRASSFSDVFRLSDNAGQRCRRQVLAISNVGQDPAAEAFRQNSFVFWPLDSHRAGGFGG